MFTSRIFPDGIGIPTLLPLPRDADVSFFVKRCGALFPMISPDTVSACRAVSDRFAASFRQFCTTPEAGFMFFTGFELLVSTPR